MIRIFTCFCLFFCISGCQKSDTRSPEYEEASRASHDRMQRELLEIEKSTADDNPFLGNREVVMGEKIIAEMRSSRAPELALARALSRLGWAELRRGLEREAIDHLIEAVNIFRSSPAGRN